MNLSQHPWNEGGVTVMVSFELDLEDTSIAFPFPLCLWVEGEGEGMFSLSEVEEWDGFFIAMILVLAILEGLRTEIMRLQKIGGLNS